MRRIGRAAAGAVAGLVMVAAVPIAAFANPAPGVSVTCGDTITKPGAYVLVDSCTGAGIRIEADDVHLDLDHSTIRQGDSTAGAGIEIGPVSNAVVSTGTIEGFDDAVLVKRAQAPRIERIRTTATKGGIVGEMDHALIRDNTILDAFDGIRVTGNDNVIRGNHVGSTASGIMLLPDERHSANGNRVEHNQVVDSSVGILVMWCPPDPCPAGPASYNVVRDNITDAGLSGITIVSGASFNQVEHNRANDNRLTGITVDRDTHGNALTRNVATGNGEHDLVDHNPTCDANEWAHNVYGTFERDCTA